MFFSGSAMRAVSSSVAWPVESVSVKVRVAISLNFSVEMGEEAMVRPDWLRAPA